jgi:hypothetical protein
MKKSLLLFVLLAGIFLTTNGQEKANPAQQTVQSIVRGVFEALATLNMESVQSYCKPDIKILENGKVWNLDSLALRVNAAKAAGNQKRINKIEFLDTRVNGNVAWTYYNNEAINTSGDRTFSIKWLESAVLVREKGEWKIALLHSTTLEHKGE